MVHHLWVLGEGAVGLLSEEAIRGPGEPCGCQRMHLPARKAGNSYKFNKIHLINYSSSPLQQQPQGSVHCPRKQELGKAGQLLLQRSCQSSGLRSGQWASAAASRMATGQQWGPGRGSWASGCTGNRSGAEARPEGTPTLWAPQSKLAMSRCSSRKALPWRPLKPDLLLTRLLMLLSCL